MKDTDTGLKTLIKKIILSAIIAFLALFASIIIESVLPFRGDDLSILVAPIVEELLKILAILIMILLVNRRCPPRSSLEDSALFWGLVIGFAFGALETAFWPGTIELKILRIPTVIMHTAAAGMSGLAIDLWLEGKRWLSPIILGSFLVHSIFNLLNDEYPVFGILPVLILLLLVMVLFRGIQEQ